MTTENSKSSWWTAAVRYSILGVGAYFAYTLLKNTAVGRVVSLGADGIRKGFDLLGDLLDGLSYSGTDEKKKKEPEGSGGQTTPNGDTEGTRDAHGRVIPSDLTGLYVQEIVQAGSVPLLFDGEQVNTRSLGIPGTLRAFLSISTHVAKALAPATTSGDAQFTALADGVTVVTGTSGSVGENWRRGLAKITAQCAAEPQFVAWFNQTGRSHQLDIYKKLRNIATDQVNRTCLEILINTTWERLAELIPS